MLLLFASAHAGLRADLDREAREGPDLAVMCTSATETLRRLREALPTLNLGNEQPLLPLMDGLETAVAPNGRLSLAMWEGGRIRLGFDTELDIEGVARWAGGLDTAPEAVRYVPGTTEWVVQSDGLDLHVRVTNRWATLQMGEGTAEPRELPAALLATVPETPGCALAFHTDDEKLGPVDLTAHLPFETTAATFGLASPALHASDAILLEGADPPPVRTPEVPDALLTVGIGLDSIDFSTFLQGKELRQARQLQNLFPVTGGSTVAFFDGATPRFAVVVPFSVMLPAPAVSRRARRIAKELELETEKIDATHFVVHVDDTALLAASGKGVLYLSTEPALLNAVQQGRGEPWMVDPHAGLAREWPVVLTSRVLPRGAGLPGVPLERPLLLALDLREGVITGLIDVPLALPQLMQIGEMLRAARGAQKAGGGFREE